MLPDLIDNGELREFWPPFGKEIPKEKMPAILSLAETKNVPITANEAVDYAQFIAGAYPDRKMVDHDVFAFQLGALLSEYSKLVCSIAVLEVPRQCAFLSIAECKQILDRLKEHTSVGIAALKRQIRNGESWVCAAQA